MAFTHAFQGYKAIIISTIVDIVTPGSWYYGGYKAIIISTIVDVNVWGNIEHWL